MAEAASSAPLPVPTLGSVPSPISAPPPRKPVQRRPTIIVVVVVAVAALLVVSLILLGGLGSGSSGSPGGVPYSAARNTADRLAASHGSWQLIEVVGLALSNSTTVPYNSTSIRNCSVTALVGSLPTTLSIPAFRGNLLSGNATVWLFAYVQPSTGSELAVFTVNGAVTLALVLTGGCLGTGLGGFVGIPDTVVSSSAAVSAAASVGGAAFVLAHPTGVSLEMFMIGPLPFSNVTRAPQWEITYSTCSNNFFSSGSSQIPGASFSVAVNATTGAVVVGTESNSTCGGGIPPPPTGIYQVLGLGSATTFQGSGTGGTIASQGCTSGDYCFSIPIAFATQNVTPSDFTTYVTNGTGALAAVAGFAILNVPGSVVVYSLGASETQWSPGIGSANTPLFAGMTLVVDFGPQNPVGQSLDLQITGEGPYIGSGMSTSLP